MQRPKNLIRYERRVQNNLFKNKLKVTNIPYTNSIKFISTFLFSITSRYINIVILKSYKYKYVKWNLKLIWTKVTIHTIVPNRWAFQEALEREGGRTQTFFIIFVMYSLSSPSSSTTNQQQHHRHFDFNLLCPYIPSDMLLSHFNIFEIYSTTLFYLLTKHFINQKSQENWK